MLITHCTNTCSRINNMKKSTQDTTKIYDIIVDLLNKDDESPDIDQLIAKLKKLKTKDDKIICGAIYMPRNNPEYIICDTEPKPEALNPHRCMKHQKYKPGMEKELLKRLINLMSEDNSKENFPTTSCSVAASPTKKKDKRNSQ